MGSESQLCGWNLPAIEMANVAETRPKIKCTRRPILHSLNRMKHKTNPSEAEQFRHFSDATRYMDEYRRKHTIANGIKEWEERKGEKSTENTKLSKYIDIRFVLRR